MLRAVMKDLTSRERWDVWMVQAERFARRENYIDALGRLRLILNEVTAALKGASDADRSGLESFRARVERRHTAVRTKFEVWNAKIAKRRQLYTDQAGEEMQRPLPLGPDEFV